jgi:hypothetical protein
MLAVVSRAANRRCLRDRGAAAWDQNGGPCWTDLATQAASCLAECRLLPPDRECRAPLFALRARTPQHPQAPVGSPSTGGSAGVPEQTSCHHRLNALSTHGGALRHCLEGWHAIVHRRYLCYRRPLKRHRRGPSRTPLHYVRAQKPVVASFSRVYSIGMVFFGPSGCAPIHAM